MDYENSVIAQFAGRGGTGFSINRTNENEKQDRHEIRGLDNMMLSARSSTSRPDADRSNISSPRIEDCDDDYGLALAPRKRMRYQSPVRSRRDLNSEDEDNYDDIHTSCSELSDFADESDGDGDDDDDMHEIRSRKMAYLSSHLDNPSCPSGDEGDGRNSLEHIANMNGTSNISSARSDRRSMRRSGPSYMWCFGCSFGPPDQDPIDGLKINTLIRIFEENYCNSEDVILAKMMHKYFKDEIYKPMKDNNKNIMMWRTRDILVHFKGGHNHDPRIWVGETLKKYKRLSKRLEKSTYMEVPSPGPTSNATVRMPVKDNIKSMLDVDDRIAKLYFMQTKKMNFFSQRSVIDFHGNRSLINVHKNFKVK